MGHRGAASTSTSSAASACSTPAIAIRASSPAIQRQLEAFTHTCFQVASYDGYVELSARLNALVAGGPNKTLLLTTGVEATENAVKIARASTNRPGVIAFHGGFHGRTLLGLSLTASSTGYRQNFGPFASEVYHTPFPYEYRGVTPRAGAGRRCSTCSTRASPPAQVAAIIIEPQLGEGGFVPAPRGVPARAAAPVHRARHRAHRRRDPDRLRPHRRRCSPTSTTASSRIW